jgi:hypothetical protein
MNNFKTVYLHKTSKAIEYMIVDMLLAGILFIFYRLADDYLGISDSVEDPSRYCYLTDGIFEEIARSKCVELEASRKLLYRIQKRDLFRCCDKMLLLPQDRSVLTKADLSPESIAACSDSGKDKLVADDVLVEWMNLNFGMGNSNPVDSVKFYHKYAPDEAFSIPQEQVWTREDNICQESVFMPSQFSEITIRVYTKVATKQKAVQVAFRRRVNELKQSFGAIFQGLDDCEREKSGEVVDQRTSPVESNSAWSTPKKGTRSVDRSPMGSALSLTPRRAETLPDDFSVVKKRPRMMMDLD